MNISESRNFQTKHGESLPHRIVTKFVELFMQYMERYILYNVRGTWSLLTTSCTVGWVLDTPFGLLIPFLFTISHVHNYNHNHLLRCVTFTQLTIIHVRDYDHLLHSYTFTLADFSAINYCLKLSQTLQLHTSKLSPRTYSANSLLKTAT
jgi:hypothetical protein